MPDRLPLEALIAQYPKEFRQLAEKYTYLREDRTNEEFIQAIHWILEDVVEKLFLPKVEAAVSHKETIRFLHQAGIVFLLFTVLACAVFLITKRDSLRAVITLFSKSFQSEETQVSSPTTSENLGNSENLHLCEDSLASVPDSLYLDASDELDSENLKVTVCGTRDERRDQVLSTESLVADPSQHGSHLLPTPDEQGGQVLSAESFVADPSQHGSHLLPTPESNAKQKEPKEFSASQYYDNLQHKLGAQDNPLASPAESMGTASQETCKDGLDFCESMFASPKIPKWVCEVAQPNEFQTYLGHTVHQLDELIDSEQYTISETRELIVSGLDRILLQQSYLFDIRCLRRVSEQLAGYSILLWVADTMEQLAKTYSLGAVPEDEGAHLARTLREFGRENAAPRFVESADGHIDVSEIANRLLLFSSRKLFKLYFRCEPQDFGIHFEEAVTNAKHDQHQMLRAYVNRYRNFVDALATEYGRELENFEAYKQAFLSHIISCKLFIESQKAVSFDGLVYRLVRSFKNWHCRNLDAVYDVFLTMCYQHFDELTCPQLIADELYFRHPDTLKDLEIERFKEANRRSLKQEEDPLKWLQNGLWGEAKQQQKAQDLLRRMCEHKWQWKHDERSLTKSGKQINLCQSLEDEQVVVAQYIKVPPSAALDVASQLRMMQMLDHPNILKLYWASQKGSKVRMVMEYVPEADEADVKCVAGGISEALIGTVCREVLQGLAYMHSLGVQHRDIRPGTIFVNGAGAVKIAKFEHAADMRLNQAPFIPTNEFYRPPEGQASDAYGIGRTALALAMGSESEHAYSQTAERASSQFLEFLQRALHPQRVHRGTVHELLALPFVQNAPPVSGLIEHIHYWNQNY